MSKKVVIQNRGQNPSSGVVTPDERAMGCKSD